MMEKVEEIRRRELQGLRTLGLIGAVQMALFSFTPFLVAFSTFALYIKIGPQDLNASNAFVALSLFTQLQFPLMMLPSVISGCIEASVALGRVNTFLRAEELSTQNMQPSNLSFRAGRGAAESKHGIGAACFDSAAARPA